MYPNRTEERGRGIISTGRAGCSRRVGGGRCGVEVGLVAALRGRLREGSRLESSQATTGVVGNLSFYAGPGGA